jgi:4-hydroxyproline epimerase
LFQKWPDNLYWKYLPGVIKIRYQTEHDKVKSVQLTNVPSYLAASAITAFCPGLGELKVDVAYGGNFYAIVEMQDHFKGIDAYTASQLIDFGRNLRTDINSQYSFVHPLDPSISGCSHILWCGELKDSNFFCAGSCDLW